MRTTDEGKRAHPARLTLRAIGTGSLRASPPGPINSTAINPLLSGPLLLVGGPPERPSEGPAGRRTLEGGTPEDLTSSTEARPGARAPGGTETNRRIAPLPVLPVR